MRWAVAAIVLAACGGGDDGGSGSGSGGGSVNGVYLSTRTVTQSEPSPSFVVPPDEAITISDGVIATNITTGDDPTIREPLVDGTHISFQQNEVWESGEGSGAATLTYDLDVDGDTISGTIAAHIIFDFMGTADFDYTLSLTGQRATR